MKLVAAGPAVPVLLFFATWGAGAAGAQEPAAGSPDPDPAEERDQAPAPATAPDPDRVTPADSTDDAPAPAEQGEVSGGAQPEPAPRPGGWVALPGVAYTPEHGLTLAGALMHYFRRGSSSAHTSRVVLEVEGSASAHGMVSLDPDVWFADGLYHLGGSTWVSYLDYTYFGVGNGTRLADGEDYTAVRMTFRPEVVRRIAGSFYAGALYEARYEDVSDVEDGGMLDAGEVTGSGGGLVSGLGLLLRWDSRDHSFAPRSGGLVTLSPRIYSSVLGSDFDFRRLVVDASWFFGLGGEHVLAVDGQADLRGGDPPFSHMSQAGGSGLMRGMLEGRFRDQHFIAAQVEYRYPLWWRFGGVAFAGLGRVAHTLADFDLTGLKYSVGGGLRFALKPRERIHVRLDVARSNDDSAYYFALLEAF